MPRRRASTEETAEELRELLVLNAFDFLERAIDEFREEPKYSVIHFSAAVELFLKARLMAEHWSLVVSDRQSADWTRFVRGDFQSVTTTEAASKLEKVVRSGLSPDALSAFKAVANHRNRAIHFFHSAHTSSGLTDSPQSMIEPESFKIAKEQLVAWHRLHRLLQRDWKHEFERWLDKIDAIEARLKNHREFLALIFEEVTPILNECRSRGELIETCHACGFGSSVHQPGTNLSYEAPCKVCGFQTRCASILCPSCEEPVRFEGEGWTTCTACSVLLEPDHIADALEDEGEAFIAARDGDSSWDRGNCADCDGYHTVVRTSSIQWFATCCLVSYDSVEICGWCNETNTGDMEMSYHSGCNQCDGYGGWTRDKDD